MYLVYKLTKYKAILTLVFILGLGFMLSPFSSVKARTANEDGSSGDVFGIGTIETGTTEDVADDSDVGIALGTESFTVTLTRIINISLSLLGILSVVIILIGGFRWMTAGGNDEKVGEARKWIFSGIIGLAIILSAWAIAKFVLKNLGDATGVEGTIE